MLVVLIAANVWLGIISLRHEKERRRKLQDRIDEFNRATEELKCDYERLKANYNEQLSLINHMRSEYDALQKKYIETRNKLSLCESGKVLYEEVERYKDEAESPKPGDKVSLLAIDFQDLQKSYNELAERYENPSKTYIINHLFKMYNIKSQSELAKTLGVSKNAINRMLKR